MKMKKFLALIMAGIMILTLAACSSGGTSDSTPSAASNTGDPGNTGSSGNSGADKLVIWTLAEDLTKFAAKYITKNNWRNQQ